MKIHRLKQAAISAFARRGLPLLAGLIGALFWTAALHAAIIDFEDLPAPGNGTGGLKVGDQYADAFGVTFSFPTAINFGEGTPVLENFAHSGTKAVELCYASEFCTGPLEIEFSAQQSFVRVWAGYTGALDSPQTVRLSAYGFGGFPLGVVEATLGPGPGPIAVAVPLEITLASAQISSVKVGFAGAAQVPATMYNNGLVIDDVEFDTSGTRSCPPYSPPPVLEVAAPVDGKVLLENVFTVDANIQTGDKFASLEISTTAGSDSRTTGRMYVSAGHFLMANLTDFLFPGANTVRIELRDCAGTRQKTLTLNYRPDLTQTLVHVTDEEGADVASAEVFVNGAYRGQTDSAGLLAVQPPVPDGTPLVARKRMAESSTYRDNHSAGSSQNWKYRAYITSLPVHDDGSTPVQSVVLEPDPEAPQELQLRRINTLIGIHVLASLEWDASDAEIEDVKQRFLSASPFLYNATDGQMLFEQIEIVDNAAHWDDADYRIYANLDLRSNVDAPLAGFFDDSFWHGSSWIHIPRGTAPGQTTWFSKFETYVHEFGHYGFGLDDEYSDDDPDTRCTPLLIVAGPYQSKMPSASCIMFSEKSAGKICSNNPLNPHVHGTEQGNSSCWHEIESRFKDGQFPARWFLLSPEDGGPIKPAINSGELPVAGWAPRIQLENRHRSNPLCQPLTIVAVDGGNSPIKGAPIWLRTTYGASILQGKTDANGELPVTGLHVGDRLGVDPLGIINSIQYYTISQNDCVPAIETFRAFAPAALAGAGGLVLAAGPGAFNLVTTFEPAAAEGQLLVRVAAESLDRKGAVKLDGPPAVTYTRTGQDAAQPVAMTFEPRSGSYAGVVDGLAMDAEVIFEITATDQRNQTVSRLERPALSGVDNLVKTTLTSADGAVSLAIPPGGLPAGTRLAIGPAPVSAPKLPPGFAVVAGPVQVKSSAGDQLNAAGTLRFQLPRLSGLPSPSAFDPATFRILRFNPNTKGWDNLGAGTFIDAPIEIVTLHVGQLGSYLLAAHVAPADLEAGPDISNAQPSLAQIWPPNHDLVPVAITGITSPYTPVSVSITRVTSDEPVQSQEGGDRCPDAKVENDRALLRAERLSKENGRVYTVFFTATDAKGHSRSGRVQVCVPHDQGQTDCPDDGLFLDATLCP